MTMVAGQRLGPYEIQFLLGAGGMGEVYKARDTRLDRTVAIKVLPSNLASHPDRRARFEREAKTIASLNHPHICTLHDVGQQDGTTYLVMEHLVGESLADRLRRGPLPVAQVLDLGAQIADALAAAHRAGIVHRDLKPANVMLVGSGRTGSGTVRTVKLLDFGLAKLSAHGEAPAATMEDAATETATLTGRGTIVGTLPYMAPEQVQGLPADGRTDIWALGAILYEMATGVRAFDAGSAPSLIAAILAQEPPSLTARLPLTPPALDRTVRRCLAKQPEDRWASAHDIAEELRGLELDAKQAPTQARASAVTWPPRAAVLVTAALLVAALGAGIYLATQRRPGPSAAPVTGPVQRTLVRVSFEPGVQSEPTWSPDGRFIAYTANRAGNLDIWVQPVSGGDPVQVTKHPAHDMQPAWSPDGRWIAYRSERDPSGIYVAPALGGRERRVSSVGYRPQWSLDGSQLLVVDGEADAVELQERAFLVALDGGPPREVAPPSGTEFRRHVTWYPPGGMISYWASGDTGGICIESLDGSVRRTLRMSEEDNRRFAEAGIDLARFRWAPEGDAILFEAGSGYSHASGRWLANLWKVRVDPVGFEVRGVPERLTSGTTVDRGLALSADGSRVAFTSRTETTRLWAMPLDAHGVVSGAGMAITEPFSFNPSFDLSLDGNTVAYCAALAGRDAVQLWLLDLTSGRREMLEESLHCFGPRFSPDGRWISYRRGLRRPDGGVRTQIIALPRGKGEEWLMPNDLVVLTDWSANNDAVLGTCRADWDTLGARVCRAPVDGGSASSALIADSEWNLWQSRYSPDGRWVVFNAVPRRRGGFSTIGIARAEGGAWTRLTDPDRFADKPRWSPDGRSIYFVGNLEPPFFDVWALPLEPQTGRAAGKPSRVTRFDGPEETIPVNYATELGVSQHRLVLNVQESSGNIWVLDSVDR
jgi:eukaryotic-like serine/threonine-protein kinase